MQRAQSMLGTALASMHIQRAYVYRPTPTKDAATGETQLTPLLVISAMPCRLSQVTLQRDDQTEAANPIDLPVKLFYSPPYDIRQGDIVEVGRVSYEAGTPFGYTSHIELLLRRRGYATDAD